jgi:hypothetical protein
VPPTTGIDVIWSHVTPRRSVDWVDNIIIDLKQIGCELVDWIKLTQGMVQWLVLVDTAIDRLVLYTMGNFFIC